MLKDEVHIECVNRCYDPYVIVNKNVFTSSLCSHIFWSSGIIDCMFVYIWKWSSAHALGGVSGVASFITTDEQLQ